MNAWNTACPDWETRLLEGRSLVPDLPLFDDEAERAVRVFNRLRIPDVPGLPRFGEAVGGWFTDVVKALLGSLDPETGRRHISEVFLLVPKKNSKSTGGAGLVLTACIVNARPAAELLLIAPTKEIADIAFSQVAGMIRADDHLSKLFHQQRHIRCITHRKTEARILIKAADTDVITGGKQLFTLVDETHVFAAHSRAREVFVELRGALAARPDGALIQITTQSKSPPAGVFLTELQRARDVRDGKRALPVLAVLYELPQAMQRDGAWKDRRLWSVLNPNLGRSVDPLFLEREFTDATEKGAEDLALFASQHLNVEIGIGLNTDRWAGADHWEAAADPSLTLESLIARSDVVVAGIDGGGLDDLLGLAVMGREKDTRRWLLWCRAWAHECVLERRKQIAPRLRDFEKEGTLTIVPDGSTADIDDVVEIIQSLEASGVLAEKHAIGVDPFGISSIADALEVAGFDAATRIAGVRQGAITQNQASGTAERRLASGELVHDGSRLMAWCAGNAKVEMRGNARAITKAQSGTAKIDPLMAALNCVTLMRPDTAPKRKPAFQMMVFGRR